MYEPLGEKEKNKCVPTTHYKNSGQVAEAVGSSGDEEGTAGQCESTTQDGTSSLFTFVRISYKQAVMARAVKACNTETACVW